MGTTLVSLLLIFSAAFYSMNCLIIEQISEPHALGEGPHWDADRQLLFYVDITNAMIFRFNPTDNTTIRAKVDAPFISFIIPVRGTHDKYVGGLGLDFCVFSWDGSSSLVPKSQIRTLFSSPSGPWKFDDGKCDPFGRVFAGTMGHMTKNKSFERNGAFYKYTSFMGRAEVQTLLTGVGVSNGLAWTKDRRTLYYVDSVTNAVTGFDYDAATGNISNRRVVFDLRKNNLKGVPDGMTIDQNDNLWLAANGDGLVAHVNPRTSTLLHRLYVPSRDVTSVVFAGRSLDQLIVTTSYQRQTKEEIAANPTVIGATFRVSGLGVTGFPSVSAVL